MVMLKVPKTPKSFFRLNKSLHLFETHCAILPLFNSIIDLLQAVKVTQSGHHLSHDRASKGYGSIPCLTSQTYLHACSQGLNTMQIYLSKKKIYFLGLWALYWSRYGAVSWSMSARYLIRVLRVKVRPNSPEGAIHCKGCKGMLPLKFWNCRLPKMQFHAYWGESVTEWGV